MTSSPRCARTASRARWTSTPAPILSCCRVVMLSCCRGWWSGSRAQLRASAAGAPASHGGLSTTLRDLARFGLLFTLRKRPVVCWPDRLALKGDFVCCQGTPQCTCSYHTCQCHCCAECNWRRHKREESAQRATPQREAPPSSAGCLCLVILSVILVSILVAVIH
jgi:hypothetical protein